MYNEGAHNRPLQIPMDFQPLCVVVRYVTYDA